MRLPWISSFWAIASPRPRTPSSCNPPRRFTCCSWGPLLLRETVRRRDLIFVAAVACGIACISQARQALAPPTPDPWRGNLYGVASGVADAFMIVGLRWLSRKGMAGAAISTVVLGSLIACFAALPQALPMGSITARDFAVLL